jgi:hypothetical protein
MKKVEIMIACETNCVIRITNTDFIILHADRV